MAGKLILFSVVGGILGYLYYRFVGCGAGSCPITSNPFASALYGAAIGLFAGLSFT